MLNYFPMNRAIRSHMIVLTVALSSACQGDGAGIEMEPTVSRVDFTPQAAAACLDWTNSLLNDNHIQLEDASFVQATCTDVVADTANGYSIWITERQAFPVAQSVVVAVDPLTGLNDWRGHDAAGALAGLLSKSP